MGSEEKVVGADLPAVLALVEARIGKRLNGRIDELLLLQLRIAQEEVKKCHRMLDPQRVVRDRFDLMGGLRHPALTPDVDNPVLRRRPGDERKGDSKDDRVAVLARPCVLACVHESEVAVRILPKAVSAPSPGTWWQIRLDRIAQLRIVRVEVEKVVAIELEQGLGDGQLARPGPGVRHVVELRGIVDRAEETRQVVEERVVTAPDEDIYLVAARR